MKLTNKKFIPYYTAAAVIILIAVIIVVALNAGKEPEPETTTAEQTTLFMNGEVPYYENIPASDYEQSSFAFDGNGRMVYSDESVSYITGVDVSSHQGEIDWEKVKDDGIDFAIIRVGYRGYGTAGNVCEDERSEYNIKGASDAGLKVGVYFYSQATNEEEAGEEADFVLDIIKNYDIDFPVVFDWENDPDVGGMRTDNMTSSQITACAVAFCEKVKKAGYIPGVYFNLTDAYDRYDLDAIKDYPFWYAQHEGEYPLFYYNYSVWQYSDAGKVDGIDAYVDLNISFSDFSSYSRTVG